MKSNSLLFSATLIAVAVLSASCGSSGGGGDEDGPRFTYDVECRGGKPWVVHMDNEKAVPKGQGPVTGATCDEAEDMEQSAVRRLDRHGEWELYHSGTTTVLTSGRYANGDKEGVWEIFDQEGRLIKRINFVRGQKDGEEIGYFAGTQEWKSRGRNSNGNAVGVWEYRHSMESDCISRGTYAADEKAGEWEECEKDQNSGEWYMAFKGEYLSGLRHGPAQMFHPTGDLMAEGSFRADTSPDCLDNPPGGVRDNCGKRTGQWSFYHPGGSKAMEGTYDSAGKRTGTWTEYYASGEKMARGPRRHTRDGWWTFWDKNGQIVGEFEFNGNDFAPSGMRDFENGRKVGEGPIVGMLIGYDAENDRIKMNDPKRNGQWVLYSPSGARIASGEFVMGRKNGEWNENGQTNCYMLGRPRACN